jgi:hypothetical protein
MERLDTMQESM